MVITWKYVWIAWLAVCVLDRIQAQALHGKGRGARTLDLEYNRHRLMINRWFLSGYSVYTLDGARVVH